MANECIFCAPGKAQRATAQIECEDCEPGKFADAVGRGSCKECPGGRKSVPGADSCDLAAAGYFIDPVTSAALACPSAGTCSGGLGLPVPKDGYWVSRDESAYSALLYPCQWDTCIHTYTNVSKSCFVPSLPGNVPDCDLDSTLCSPGSHGPLCGSCSQSYVFDVMSNTCIFCAEASKTMSIILGVFVSCALIAIIVTSLQSLRTQEILRVIPLFNKIEPSSLRVIW